jgi:hypothetical protein
MRYLRELPALLALALLSPAAITAQDSSATRPVRLTYVTPSSAYIDAGRQDGLHEGDTLTVVRGEVEAGRLRVTYLASRQASCDILAQSSPLVLGDTVRFVRAATTVARASAGAAPATGWRQPGRHSGPGLHGRAGARYLGVWQRNGSGAHFSQPSFDIRLDAQSIGGSAVGLVLDLRTRRTVSSWADGERVVDGRTRVYQGALFVAPAGSPLRVTAGRQFSSALASVTLFDGVMAELARPSWGVGAFGGSEPEPENLGYSTAVRDYGGYLQLHSTPDASSRWTTTLGAIGSYRAGVTNREFLFLQAGYSSRRLSLFGTQEVDYYRGWKQAMGERAWSPTGTFAMLRYELSPRVSVNTGYDSRRNVRLYRDAVTPETAFDDAFRQGVWGGLWIRTGAGRVGLDARSSSGGSAGRTQSYTLSLGLDRVTALQLGLRSRTTRYDGPRQSGWLQSFGVDVTPAPLLRLGLDGGLRIIRDPLADPSDYSVTWLGVDMDVNLGRRWYLMMSGTHEVGGIDSNDQIFGGISYRF